ncbi:MAG: hypothetical protein R3B96_24325 [Pirellulaceae bacterium]
MVGPRIAAESGFPNEWRDHPLDLFFESADDAREIRVNGTRVVLLGDFPPNYRSGLGGTGRYGIPADLVRYGETNSVEVRVYRDRGRERFNVAAPAFFTDTEAIHLSGRWEEFRDDRLLGPDELPPEQFIFRDVKPSAEVRKCCNESTEIADDKLPPPPLD